MRRFRIAVAIFAAIVLLVWAADRRLDAFHSAAQARCDALIAAAESGEDARVRREIETLFAWWEDSEGILLMIVDHAHIDNISFSMAKLLPLWEGGEETDFLVEAHTIRAAARHLWRSESASVSNLF